MLREEALAKRETDVLSLEVEYKNKLEGIDSEVALRARSGIAAAEAREAASERRAVMREVECQQRESCFAAAERELAVRSIEIAPGRRPWARTSSGASRSASTRC